jgi:hypothetical protein
VRSTARPKRLVAIDCGLVACEVAIITEARE